MTAAEYAALYDSRRALIDATLAEWLPASGGRAGIAAAMRYAIEGNGKRLRPVMMLEFYSLSGRDERDVLPFACALEYIHGYSLVHDDMPCMDDSALRRGKPSVHKKFGEWQGLLAGDALLNYAFETASGRLDLEKIRPETAIKCIAELSAASGIYGMVGGQELDLDGEGKHLTERGLTELQDKKTGALIRAAGRIGCIAAERDCKVIELATEYCDSLGLMFQMTDDLLDMFGDEKTLGKPTGADGAAEKSTFASELGAAETRRRAEELTARCKKIATGLGSEFLAVLAEKMLDRKE